MPKLNPHESLRLCSMGKMFPITALFTTDDDANRYLETHRDEGVIAEIQGVVFIANLYVSEPQPKPTT